MERRYPGPVTHLCGRRLPEEGTPAGYAALIDGWNLHVPLPRRLAFVLPDRRRHDPDPAWLIFPDSYRPDPTLEGHLTFALKYEGLDLAVLKRLFAATGPEQIEAWVRSEPTGSYSRRVWFLYEWLFEVQLDLPQARGGRYVPVIDPELQYAAKPRSVTRQRVHDNLPGTPQFAPLVYRTEQIEAYRALDLPERAREVVAAVSPDILHRTAAFLLLKDSRSSYIIEGESPPETRAQRWGRAIGEAGRHPLDRDEFLRLQSIVLGDAKFVELGFRSEGGFVGSHDRGTRVPIPEHISARPEDISSLVEGLIDFDNGRGKELDPVLAATLLAFGFVYIHPFADGNGRVHRYLIHHVLTERGFNPSGLIFPVSSAILEAIDRYREVLESYSRRLLPVIAWRPTADFNVEVTNDTADFYRYFDATPHVAFLWSCIEKTIEEDLPRETDFLRRYDMFERCVSAIVEMPDRTTDLLFRFLEQNGGRLSKRARGKEFAALTDREVKGIEGVWGEVFGEEE